MGPTDVLILVYQTLWLWELMAVIMWFLWKGVLQPIGKFKAVRLQYREGQWFLGGVKWVPLRARKWAMRTGESHTTEMDATVLMEGTHPWLMYDTKGTRPLQVTIKSTEHKISAKVYNPDSEEFDKYATRLAFFQMLRANALGHPGILFIAVIGAVGFVIGLLGSPYILPVQHYAAPVVSKSP